MSTISLDKINELISLKEFEEAKTELENLLKNDANNVEALKTLGLCNVNLGFFNEGKNNFETVVKYKNDDATSWFYLANCYDNLNDFLHAKTAYLKVIELRGNYLDAYKNLGIIYIKNKEPEKALKLAYKALAFVKDDYLIHYLIGTAYLALKKSKNSIPYFETAIELNSTHAQLYNNLGTAYLTIGNYNEAFENYIKASILEPKNPLTLYNIASILQIQNKLQEACEYFQRAYEIENSEHYLISLALCEFKSNQYEAAIKHYKLLISKHPEKHNFQYNLACCYEAIGEYTFAIGILNQLVLLNPKSKMMLQKLANLYLKINQPQNTKEIYERIIQQGIVSAEIYYEYALICVKTGDLDISEKILKKVIELNPTAANARKDLGVIYLSKRLFDYAKDEFEKAYELEPENNEIIFEYANFRHATSDFLKAHALYEKAFEQDPTNPNILIFSALNALSLNNQDEALKYIELALKLVPQDAFVLLVAGKINHALKDFEKAQLYLIKSWEKLPTIDVENLLGLNYFELGEYDKANAIFRDLSNKNPMNVNLLLNSAKCYEKSDAIDMAKEQLKKVLTIFPEMEEAKKMLEKWTID